MTVREMSKAWSQQPSDGDNLSGEMETRRNTPTTGRNVPSTWATAGVLRGVQRQEKGF